VKPPEGDGPQELRLMEDPNGAARILPFDRGFSPFLFPHALQQGQTHFLLWTVLDLRPLVLTSLAVPFLSMLNPQRN